MHSSRPIRARVAIKTSVTFNFNCKNHLCGAKYTPAKIERKIRSGHSCSVSLELLLGHLRPLQVIVKRQQSLSQKERHTHLEGCWQGLARPRQDGPHHLEVWRHRPDPLRRPVHRRYRQHQAPALLWELWVKAEPLAAGRGISSVEALYTTHAAFHRVQYQALRPRLVMEAMISGDHEHSRRLTVQSAAQQLAG